MLAFIDLVKANKLFHILCTFTYLVVHACTLKSLWNVFLASFR